MFDRRFKRKSSYFYSFVVVLLKRLCEQSHLLYLVVRVHGDTCNQLHSACKQHTRTLRKRVDEKKTTVKYLYPSIL